LDYAAYLKFARRIFDKRGAMPLYFVFFITERCLAHCRHCLLGQKELTAATNELSLEEIERVARSMDEIMFLLLTGGDPFLRPDLPEIVQIFHRHNRVRNLGMPTNGSVPAQVERSVERILQTCPDLDYAVDISIDGIGADHDELRRLPGLFDKAIETYRRLERLRDRYANFNLNVAVTVSAFNQDKLDAIYDYLRAELGVRTINQLLTRGSPRDPEAGNVDIEKYLRFSRRLAEDTHRQILSGYTSFPFSDFVNAMKHVRQELIARMLRENRHQVPCFAANLAGVMYADGDVYPCELLEERLGNVREVDYDFRRIWFSERAEGVRRHIRETKCFCTYECFLTNSILFNPRQLPRVLGEVALLKWHRFRRGKGPGAEGGPAGPAPAPENGGGR
jgi:MoaA/NifB/PqqE/SkfB family radical SAM enzyme